MKKLIAIVLTLALCLSLAACGSKDTTATTAATTPASEGADSAVTEAPADAPAAMADMKVGFIFLHDENSTYDLNFMNAAKEACAELGLTEEQSRKSTRLNSSHAT